VVGRVVAGAAALVAIAGGQAVAWAAPTPAPSPAASNGTAVCTVNDQRLVSASGLSVNASGFLITPGQSDTNPESLSVFHVTPQCSVSSVDTRPRLPRDLSDLAVGSDGATYVADFGDADASRSSIAVWKLGSNGATSIYRMSYPDGAKDARAMLLAGPNSPIVVTTTGDVYTPSQPLKADIPAPGIALTKAGHFAPPRSDTPNPLGLVGSSFITSGAVSSDGKLVVLRTYSDAYEWQVGTAGVAATITTGQPRHIPLPNEIDGQAIAYGDNNASFYTTSLTAGNGGQVKILKYNRTPASTASPAAAKIAGGGPSWFSKLSLSDLTTILASTAAFGVVMVVIGVVAIRRTRIADGDAHGARGRGGRPSRAWPAGSSARGSAPRPRDSRSSRGTTYRASSSYPGQRRSDSYADPYAQEYRHNSDYDDSHGYDDSYGSGTDDRDWT
jgi:hypothetical protein